jgi:tetratricopeptide (TPR) repeat protein
MAHPSHADRPAPPPLAELFAEYLRGQTAAQAEGLGFADFGEVEPFESVPVQPVDPKQAWADALAVADVAGAPPSEWPAMVAGQEPAVALAFCLGNYPQLVRNLHPLLARGDLAALRAGPAHAPEAPALVEWARGRGGYPETLLAAGVLRLARQFDAAEELLRRPPPAEWRAAHANEVAALAWHRGRAEEAATLWRKQADSTPVLFNRGMAALFLGDADAAREALNRAAAALPETSAWHHLARLYLAMTAARD